MKNDKIIYRYERKFCVDKIDKVQIESIIKKNPAFFKEIFEERIVNNFYFDTRGFQSYIENKMASWIGQNIEFVGMEKQ